VRFNSGRPVASGQQRSGKGSCGAGKSISAGCVAGRLIKRCFFLIPFEKIFSNEY
jgi:hypothetical protein